MCVCVCVGGGGGEGGGGVGHYEMWFPFQHCRILTVWTIIGSSARLGHRSLLSVLSFFTFSLSEPLNHSSANQRTSVTFFF